MGLTSDYPFPQSPLPSINPDMDSRKDDSGQKRVLIVNSPHGTLSERIGRWSSRQKLNIPLDETTKRGQGRFANQLFNVSRNISHDARSFFYSRNKVRFYGLGARGIPHLSAMTTTALRSLRDI
jgi:hypothetical protein